MKKAGLVGIVFLSVLCSYAQASQFPDDLGEFPLLTEDKIMGVVEKFSMGEPVGDSFSVDINGDKNPEKFIGTDCGQAGCFYCIFSPVEAEQYRLIGFVNLTRNFEVLETSHEGFHDLLDYWSLSAKEGDLNRFSYDSAKHRYDGIFIKPVSSDVADIVKPTYKPNR